MHDVNTQAFWEQKYKDAQTGWDLGGITPQFEWWANSSPQLNDRILIPGAGYGHEAQFLADQGFTNVTVIDIVDSPLLEIGRKTKGKVTLIHDDFFNFKGSYDWIWEQTFFCALPPSMRHQYVVHMHSLLPQGGRLTGLLFNRSFDKPGPPFGGSKEEYIRYFEPYFEIIKMEPAEGSVLPRLGQELFFEIKPINP